MIITVTLNAAIDKTLAVPNFTLGRRHRTVDQSTNPGGKGVNVARLLKRLGRPVIATGFAGGPTGTRIVEQLTEESVLSDFVRIREESRTNMAVIDPTTGEQTEINERGPRISESELELFIDKLLYLAQGAEVCVFAGSLPRGLDEGIYGRMIRELEKSGVETYVDAEGEPLSHAVAAHPTTITPNVVEAEELVGHEFTGDEDLVAAVFELANSGPRDAFLTLPDGAVACVHNDDELVLMRAKLEPLEAVSTIGSGDAFLAGLVAARYVGGSVDECLRYATACGAESTQHFGAGVIDSVEVSKLAGQVQLTPLRPPVEA